jgi:hypothetical protein
MPVIPALRNSFCGAVASETRRGAKRKCRRDTVLGGPCHYGWRPYAGFMTHGLASSRIHMRSGAHSAATQRTLGDAHERPCCRRAAACVRRRGEAGLLAKAGASARRKLRQPVPACNARRCIATSTARHRTLPPAFAQRCARAGRVSLRCHSAGGFTPVTPR